MHSDIICFNFQKYDSLTTENKALKCLLSKANQEMAGITESLQEAEKKSCHLEQLVAEARHALQSQTEVTLFLCIDFLKQFLKRHNLSQL